MSESDWLTLRAAAGDDLDALTSSWPDGLYTTFRTLNNGRQVVGLSRHLARMYEPAEALGIRPRLRPAALRRRLAQAFAALEAGQEARARLHLAADGRFFLAWQPFRPLPAAWYRRGVRAVTVPQLQRAAPRLKRSDFARQRQAALEALRAQGAHEGLLLRRGRILEGLSSNFFYLQGGVLGTAGRGVLPGVTRAVVLQLAHEIGLPRRYRALPLRELPEIEEAFICSSSRALLPVVRIDGLEVGAGRPGPLTRRLLRAYCRRLEAWAEPLAG